LHLLEIQTCLRCIQKSTDKTTISFLKGTVDPTTQSY